MFFFCGRLTEALVSVLVGARGAPLGADTLLQHVALHALQAVGPQGTATRVAAPVTLCRGAEERNISRFILKPFVFFSIFSLITSVVFWSVNTDEGIKLN